MRVRHLFVWTLASLGAWYVFNGLEALMRG
jgi:hypothetical protein